MTTPEDEAVRATIFDWQEAIIQKEKIDQSFLKDALLAIIEGMLNFEKRISTLEAGEWRGTRELVAIQDEFNLMRYKMIILQKEIEK